MKILFLGPIPPPVHGFSAINLAMLDNLRSKGQVSVFNRANPTPEKPVHGIAKHASLLMHWAKLLASFSVAAAQKPISLYAGLSGGKGQILDLPFFLMARLFKIPTYVHHHSFAYINQKSWITALCVLVLGKAQHIALCPEMAKGISTTYGIHPRLLTTLSNAAFLPNLAPEVTDSNTSRQRELSIRVGFLSNITAEKGIFEFFSTLRQADAAGLHYKAEIAGPVDTSIRKRFESELAELPNAKHIGPIYGIEKQRFFQRIDLLLFPTRYQNEAEPVTLHEALQAGATVVAANRGCIGGMLPDNCGSAQPAEEFITSALDTLRKLDKLNAAQRSVRREDIKSHYKNTAIISQKTLMQLVTKISSPAQKSI